VLSREDMKIINIMLSPKNIFGSIVSSNQSKMLINSSKNYVLLLFQETQPREESVRVRHPWRDVPKRRNNRWNICCKHTQEYSMSLKGCHLRGKWGTRNNFSLNP
jgi:hypothetical protein